MQDIQTLLPVGSVLLDRYRVEELLGKGGSGAVYLVQDQRVQGNEFALKEIIYPDKKELARFLFEGKVLMRLDHDALPRVYRIFEDAQQVRTYILMDYVEGPNLDTLRRLQPRQRFPLPQVMTMMAPIVEAVSYLHQQNPPIIHRDIKPANIIVPTAGENTVLVDFGIAKEYDQDATTTAVRRASPGYGAPEQYAIGTNPRTDVYGMAATFYALLTGTVPADAFYRMTQLSSRGTDPLVPVQQLNPDIPVLVAEAIQRAMSLDSDQRFPTVQAFWQALQMHNMPVSAPVPIAPQLQVRSLPATSEVENVSTIPVSPLPKNVPVSSARKRRFPILPALIFIVLAALLAGIAMIANEASTHAFLGQPAPTSAVHTVTATSMTATATYGQKSPVTNPAAQPSSSSMQTPPSSSTQVPSSAQPPFLLAGGYSGTIHNNPVNVSTTMQLTAMHQQGTNITGYLALSSGLQGSGNFSGAISADRHIRFLVDAYAGNLPLLFDGQVQPNGTLSGSYCSARNNQCDYSSGGYGTWSVSPLSTGS